MLGAVDANQGNPCSSMSRSAFLFPSDILGNLSYTHCMLKISTKGQYALLIMTDLAEQDPEKFVPLKLLSHRHNLSVKYLEQILIQLSKSGLVTGLRGNNGGYKLVKKPEEYSIGEILRALEGDHSPRGNTESNAVSSVGNDVFWKDFEDVINKFVDSVTLEEVAQRNREFNGFDYCI